MIYQVVRFNDWYVPWHNRMDPISLQLRGAQSNGFRMDGSISSFGTGRRPVQDRVHAVSFFLKNCGPSFSVEDSPEIERMMSALLDGQGRLWWDSPARRGPELWCLGDLNDVSVTPNRNNWAQADVIVEWQLYNPILYRPLNSAYITNQGHTPITVDLAAYGESLLERTFARFNISASPTTFTIDCDGQMKTSQIVIRLESLGVNGFTNPKIENTTTEQWIRFGVTGATADHVVQARCTLGPHRVRRSTDGGLSFVTDPSAGNIWTSTTISDTQVPLMELAPGENNFTVTDEGTPNFRVMILWEPAYGIV